jgi:hypothetical protein
MYVWKSSVTSIVTGLNIPHLTLVKKTKEHQVLAKLQFLL